jgi:hypothetical protein
LVIPPAALDVQYDTGMSQMPVVVRIREGFCGELDGVPVIMTG